VVAYPNQPSPGRNYLLGWTGPPEMYATQAHPTAGEVYLQRIGIATAGVAANLFLYLVGSGSSMTAGQNFAGLYTLSGGILTRVAVSADLSSVLTGSAVPTTGPGPGIALVPGVAVASGQDVWAAQLYNSSGTTPNVSCSGNQLFDLPNIGDGVANWAAATPPYPLAPQGFRYGSFSSGLTALPATIALNLVNPDKAFMAAVGA
jgi:hypothetical protein